MSRILSRLAKWRNVFMMMATMGSVTSSERWIRDQAEKHLLLRVDANAIVALLIQKGVFSQIEYTAQLEVEAEALMEALEKSYPGFRAGDDGMILANPQAHQTMQGWMRPWGTGER